VGGSGRRDRWQGRRTFTGSLTKHVGASLLSAWACMPASIRVCAACDKGSPGKSGEACAGHQAAGACSRVGQQARSRRALCRGQQGERARCAGFQGTWRFLRVCGQFERDQFKASAELSNSLSPSQRAQVCFPSCPRHSARLLRACCPTLLHAPAARYPAHASPDFPGLPLPHAHTHTHVVAGMHSKPMH
jgi:hypothetical protein